MFSINFLQCHPKIYMKSVVFSFKWNSMLYSVKMQGQLLESFTVRTLYSMHCFLLRKEATLSQSHNIRYIHHLYFYHHLKSSKTPRFFFVCILFLPSAIRPFSSTQKRKYFKMKYE